MIFCPDILVALQVKYTRCMFCISEHQGYVFDWLMQPTFNLLKVAQLYPIARAVGHKLPEKLKRVGKSRKANRPCRSNRPGWTDTTNLSIPRLACRVSSRGRMSLWCSLVCVYGGDSPVFIPKQLQNHFCLFNILYVIFFAPRVFSRFHAVPLGGLGTGGLQASLASFAANAEASADALKAEEVARVAREAEAARAAAQAAEAAANAASEAEAAARGVKEADAVRMAREAAEVRKAEEAEEGRAAQEAAAAAQAAGDIRWGGGRGGRGN